MAKWNPGLMSAGGIPNRTTIYKTLSPSGRDDTAAIQAALNAAFANQVVMLNPGTFIVNDILLINRPVTLRGSGAGVTKLVKTNGAKPRTSAVIGGTKGILTPVNPGSYSYDQKPVIIVGPSRWNNGPDSTASQDLTADGVQGADTVTVADAKNFKPGAFVLLDEVSGATWQPAPVGLPGDAQVWQGDRVAWNMHLPHLPGDDSGASNAQGPYDNTPARGASGIAQRGTINKDRRSRVSIALSPLAADDQLSHQLPGAAHPLYHRSQHRRSRGKRPRHPCKQCRRGRSEHLRRGRWRVAI
jgi:hypothetical protein